MPYKKVYVEKKKPGKGHWSEEKKLEVMQAFLALGQLRMAAASCNVPEITARQWKASQWWRNMEAELRRSGHIQLSTKLQGIVNKTITQLEDRVENGDFILKKNGEVVRKGISAEHANKIVTQLIDRRLVLEKAAAREKEDDVGIEARLLQIKQELVQLAKKPLLNQRVIESEVIDVPSSSEIEGTVPTTSTEDSGPGFPIAVK